MKSATMEEQPELGSLYLEYQGLNICRGGVGVGRSHVIFCFWWV